MKKAQWLEPIEIGPCFFAGRGTDQQGKMGSIIGDVNFGPDGRKKCEIGRAKN